MTKKEQGKQMVEMTEKVGLAHIDGVSLARRLHLMIVELIPTHADQDLLEEASIYKYHYTLLGSLDNTEKIKVLNKASEFKKSKHAEIERAKELESEAKLYSVNANLLIVSLAFLTGRTFSFTEAIKSIESMRSAIDSMVARLHELLWLIDRVEEMTSELLEELEEKGEQNE